MNCVLWKKEGLPYDFWRLGDVEGSFYCDHDVNLQGLLLFAHFTVGIIHSSNG